MSSETPADPPKIESKSTANAEPPTNSKADVEYDDFGLPIRKPRARTPIAESSESEDEQFEDAVSSKNASTENVVHSEKVEENDTPKKAAADRPGPTTKEGYALPQLNGRVKQVVGTIEHKVVEEKVAVEKPVVTKKDVVAGSKPEEGDMEKEQTTEPEQSPEKSEREHSQEKPGPEETQAEIEPEQGSKDVTAPSSASVEPTEDTKQSPSETDNKQLEKGQERKSIEPPPGPTSAHRHQQSVSSLNQYSHQHALQPRKDDKEEKAVDEGEWQTMPAYARFDMYDDDDKLIAKENVEELEDLSGYANLGGAAKGYTRVIMDDDADSVTSLDDNTAYLFKEQNNGLHEEDEVARDPLSQMQATKNLLTEGQRVAYVGLVRLATVEMEKRFAKLDRNRNTKKAVDMQQETTKMWSQLMMLRLYGHMDITQSEQVMIEQLSQHGVVPADLTPALMKNARVRNPAAEEISSPTNTDSGRPSVSSTRPDSHDGKPDDKSKSSSRLSLRDSISSPPPPPYEEEHEEGFEYPEVKSPSELPQSKNLDIDLRWTVMCDLFLVLISDGVYDARSRELFEQVGKYLSVDWLEICRFEKRVTDALEMQEQADKENWNEEDHMKARAKRARNKRLAFMGLATVGGGLVIGLSAGLLAPVIGAGLAAGFTTIGVAGTGSFLAGAGGAAVITTTGVVTGSTVGVRAANRRTGNVKTFEYRPLHNNKRTNLIITLAGWMNGKVDDVRLPYSTVDPIMGDIYSVLWEPEMLRSMGDTINILATEVSKINDMIKSTTKRRPGSYTRSPTSARQHYFDCLDGSHDVAAGIDKTFISNR